MHPAIISEQVAGYYYQSTDWSAVAAAMFASAGYGGHVDSGDYPFLIDKNTRGFLENAAISEDDKIILVTKMQSGYCTCNKLTDAFNHFLSSARKEVELV
ncbi:hypothetical protein GCM10007423_11640 [Dyadobacter endophyticus]|uniref:Uncharacterized protein n=1 Tax=Dyadobacter endophyticus TaxID=1749036 RepID=A0ABQ1YIU5_9BACT|nr:hypothetical protein [Dyadobacter endophyticus]GGH26561.1 hypothetical protein GCM10007423_11640 [Dyadobacter endophyticus]